MVDRKILNKNIKQYSLNNYQLLHLDMILHSIRPILCDILAVFCLISSENDSHKLFAPELTYFLSPPHCPSLCIYTYIYTHTITCVCICMYKLTYNELY